MKTTLLTIDTLHKHGELFAQTLRARHRAFIQRRQWQLPEVRGMEFDQYDTPHSSWVCVHDGDTLLGGLRITPTTARCGIYTYMIKDAQDGRLEGMPSDLLHDRAPVDPHVWESSRVFVCEDAPAAQRSRIQMAMHFRMLLAAREEGVRSIVAMLPATWPRWGKRLGMDMVGIGPVMDMGGIEYQAVSIAVREGRQTAPTPAPVLPVLPQAA